MGNFKNTEKNEKRSDNSSFKGVGDGETGYYGIFGGAYIPEILHGIVNDLTEAFYKIKNDPTFKEEYYYLL